MKTELDTIREALEYYAQGDWNGDPAKQALAAISTIEAEADPFAMHVCGTCSSDSGAECTRRNCHLNNAWEPKPARDTFCGLSECAGRSGGGETEKTTNKERAEEIRLKLESIHKQVLLDYAADVRRERASFDEIKEYLIGKSSEYKSEYIQAAIVILREMFKERAAILATEPARDSLPETKSTGGANTLAELISLLEIARDNKTGVSLDWVEIGIALRSLTEPAREES